MPKISVILPTYNAEKYLQEAIDSLLAQTFQDFEILIVDDGSKDRTLQILKTYDDPRIKIFQGPQKGISAALNMGLDLAQGMYVARMDADDISLPRRFEKQVAFMDEHPNIGICGTDIEAFEDSKSNVWNYFPDVADTKTMLLFGCALAHPTVMIRLSIFKEFNLRYDESYFGSEDFELWNRAMEFTDVCSIPEVLVRYRLHKAQASALQLENDRKRTGLIVIRGMKNYLGIDIPEKYGYIFYACVTCYTFNELLEMSKIFHQAYLVSFENSSFKKELILTNFSHRLNDTAFRSLNIFQLFSFFIYCPLPLPSFSWKNYLRIRATADKPTAILYFCLKKLYYVFGRGSMNF